jgi:phosphopantetheinyl transferase
MAFSHFGTTNELTCKTTAEKITLFQLMWTLVLAQQSSVEDLD